MPPRFTDSAATIIDSNKIPPPHDALPTPPSLATASSMGAVTKPLHGGLSTSVDAVPTEDNVNNITYTHPELGWCVNFIPPLGMMTQMMQLQELRENHPADATDLCQKCEHLTQIASFGELTEFREVCGTVISIPNWNNPPPLWYVGRIFSAAVIRGNMPLIQWLIEGGVSPRTLPPVADVIHDVVNKFLISKDDDNGESTLNIISYLVLEGNFDISRPRKGDGWTPLHIASQRNLFIMAKHLIFLGADVNSVGRDDVMPLNLADRIAKMLKPSPQTYRNIHNSDSETEEEEADDKVNDVVVEKEEDKKMKEDVKEIKKEEETDLTPLQALLLSKGARRTWRREPAPPPSVTTLNKPNKPVRFSGGFTQQDMTQDNTVIEEEETAGTSSAVQRADGGFTLSCE